MQALQFLSPDLNARPSDAALGRELLPLLLLINP
jgi:hypothetical protein